MTIEVIETATEVVEVIEAGPKGDKGDPGEAGEGASRRTVISTSTLVQPVPHHDGTSGTESVIDIGTISVPEFNIVNGVIEVIQNVENSTLVLELHTSTTGGGNKIAQMVVWAQYSADLGATWLDFPESTRIISIADENSGLHTMNVSTGQTLPVGALARFMVTNNGDPQSNLSIQGIDFTSSVGPVSGRSAKLVASYDIP